MAKADSHNDDIWRFGADWRSGFALCFVGYIKRVDVAEEAQHCALGTFLAMFCLVDSDMNTENENVNGPLATAWTYN